jgi:hypothetical protein
MVSEENLMQLIAYIRTLKPAEPAEAKASKDFRHEYRPETTELS